MERDRELNDTTLALHHALARLEALEEQDAFQTNTFIHTKQDGGDGDGDGGESVSVSMERLRQKMPQQKLKSTKFISKVVDSADSMCKVGVARASFDSVLKMLVLALFDL